MAGLWYRVGTVSVTSGSKKVTGFGTKWKTSVSKPDKGHPVHAPDGRIYELDYVESDTVLWLVSSYAGATAADQSYAIDITRTGTVPAFARDLSTFVAYHQGQLDGWQKILTGTGDVTLIAPDGTNLTIPSWEKVMNAGTGVVAQATAQAAIATAEAAKAAESASVAATIVGAAALPIPDVWAPLTESLRLFTGYGREVKVGEDVIARMLTFSRSTTKTYTNRDGLFAAAAVNEPTFDLWGLQLDGRSQNLVVTSEISPRALQAGKYQISATSIKGYALHSCVYESGDDALVVETGAALQRGGVGSFILDSNTTTGSWTCHFNGVDTYADFWPRNEAVFDYADLGNGLVRVSRKLSGTALNVLHMRCHSVAGSRIDIGCYQIEESPVASAYIPTVGAAATRAADLLTLQNSLNIPVGAGDMTVAVEVRRNPEMPSNLLPRIFHVGANTWLTGDSGGFSMRGGTENQGRLVNDSNGEMETVVYRIKGNQITVRCGSAAVTVTRTGAITANGILTNIGSDETGGQSLFGHVRNLRVWRHALTDEQMKAIA